ncbi:sensor histidine kinase [Glycomyces terrestris]|uniref:histidine kinase n=1 Tax=Glycomyces terrestris TaxID=2493553 RepID=A0A426V391_9ACTN|nr:histidine kinase [Glycomyces terrestris]RRS01363.1 two-component sensor histidine kinase [Glycomyces terrestris]
MVTVPARVRRAALAAAAGALVLAAALLPGEPGPAGHLAELTGAARTLWTAPLLALAAAFAAWWSPVALWPLLLVAAAAPLADPTGAAACALVASLVASRRLRRTATRLAFVLAATAWTAVPVALGLAADEAAAVGAALSGWLGAAALFVWTPFSSGLWAAARRDLLAQARERAERLERDQLDAAERARALERTRIAHDMHDVVAHRVSLMVLHAGALEVNTADPEAAEAAELIRATGVEALEQLREVLGVLRDPARDRAPGAAADLDRLVDESIRAGVPVTLRRRGSPEALPAHVAGTLWRAAREALTNVHKHAGAVPTVVDLDCSPERAVLRVRNAAPALEVRAIQGSGIGLVAIREAVALLEGAMAAGATPDGGFELRIALPLPIAASPGGPGDPP